MDHRQRCRYIVFIVLLTAGGGWLLQLCSRFSGFRHPLLLPGLLGGVCATAAFFLLLLRRE